jgi:hypothetical protein
MSAGGQGQKPLPIPDTCPDKKSPAAPGFC